MKIKFITALFLGFVMTFWTQPFAQDGSSEIDANQEFSVNPNPHQFVANQGGGPLEEIFGLNQNGLTNGPRARGNLFSCTTERKIVEHRVYLAPTVATQMWFCIYEGDLQVGTYNLVHSVDVSPQGPGEAWYSSGIIDFNLVAGKYYLIIASFEQLTTYWNENPVDPYPVPASFGLLTAGAGWNWAPTASFPPPATQEVEATAFGEPVAYYQTIFTDATSSVPGSDGETVNNFQLYNNFPNPFNPTTKIYFSLPQESFVNLTVFDVLGNEIAVLISENKPAGFHNVDFDASSINSGVYFYKLEAGSFTDIKKMVLLR